MADTLPAGSTAASTSALTPALFKRLHPKAYLDKFLGEQIRPDGRPLASTSSSGNECWRESSMNLGSISTAPSSSLVRLGNTSVVCGLTLEIAPPQLTAPHSGFIVPNIDLPPLCSASFRPGPPSDEAQVLSSRLKDILAASNLLPLEKLLIEPGKAAFVVYLDVVCLDYDGGVLDAAVLACVGALRNLVLPEANYDIDTGKTTCEPISQEHPGTKVGPLLGPAPVAVSFGVFNGHLLPDPTEFEARLCTSHITIVLASPSPSSTSQRTQQVKQKKSDLLYVYQAGASSAGGGGGKDRLRECLALARGRAKELFGVVLGDV